MQIRIDGLRGKSRGSKKGVLDKERENKLVIDNDS